jgi:hypothetical protein
VIAVACEELSQESCPCLLAETDECPHCPLLRGEAVCGCDWQGRCAYECYQWRDDSAAGRPAGAVLAVRPFAAATGLVLRAEERLGAAPVGTAANIRLPLAGGSDIRAVLLRVYPSGLVYLLTFDPCPAGLLLGRTVKPRPVGNAFAGWQTLAAAEGRTIVLAVAAPLAEPLAPLAGGLRRRGNEVTFAPSASAGDADIVFAAGPENEIKRVATGLPPSFRGKIVTWVTGG